MSNLYCGHLLGGQPVPHPDFENQRFPMTVRRIRGVPGLPFPAVFLPPGVKVLEHSGPPRLHRLTDTALAAKATSAGRESHHGLEPLDRHRALTKTPIQETPNHGQFRQESWFPFRTNHKIKLKINQQSISRPSGPGDCFWYYFQLEFTCN